MSDFLNELRNVADERPVEERTFEGEYNFVGEVDQFLTQYAAVLCSEIKDMLMHKVQKNDFVTTKGKRVASLDYVLPAPHVAGSSMEYILSMRLDMNNLDASFINKYDPKLLEKYKVKKYCYDTNEDYLQVGILDINCVEKKQYNILKSTRCKIKSTCSVSDNHFTHTFYTALANNLYNEGLSFNFSLSFDEIIDRKYKKYKELPIIPGQPVKSEVSQTSEDQPYNSASGTLRWRKMIHVEAVF